LLSLEYEVSKPIEAIDVEALPTSVNLDAKTTKEGGLQSSHGSVVVLALCGVEERLFWTIGAHGALFACTYPC
jgi:hypothetical protein